MHLYKITNYLSPDRILDIGANIGQFHQEAKQSFPNSFIFSIEASNECEEHLKQITDNYFIGMLAKDNNSYDYFSRKDAPTGTGNSYYRELTHYYSDENLDIIKKNRIKLDDLFEEDSVFDLIKIDTQGSELDIIEGGIELCKKAKGILLEVSLTQYNENSPLYDEVIQFMDNIGFKPVEELGYGHHPTTGELIQKDILFTR